LIDRFARPTGFGVSVRSGHLGEFIESRRETETFVARFFAGLPKQDASP
jgi:hypothetical protein